MSGTTPGVAFATAAPDDGTDVIVVAVARDGDDISVTAPMLTDTAVEQLTAAAETIGHDGRPETTMRIPAPSGVPADSVLLVGVGDGLTEGRDAHERHDRLRRTAGAALRAIGTTTASAIALPIGDAADAEAVATGALLGAYRFTAYRTRAHADPSPRTITVLAPEPARAGVDRAAIIATAVAGARDLVNRPASDLFPQAFADAVLEQSADLGAAVAIEVTGEDELAERGFGGLIGVGQGSTRGPRLVRIAYSPHPDAPLLSLVGKGITFDSGGISIKPAARMEVMKSDMAGAAAAAHAVFAIARLGLPVRVTAWLALAENMPSGSALRPSDVLRMYDGTTVEVTNTDAEGRLVLADALVAAQEGETPDLLVDIATLTGAQVAALGRRTSGIMGTPHARERVMAAAESTGERMWAMPIPEEMIRFFDSTTADLKNAGATAGGMLAAAAFLREFVGDGVEWAHLDIAGPAFNTESAYGYTVLGGTGVPVRTLVEVAAGLAGTATGD